MSLISALPMELKSTAKAFAPMRVLKFCQRTLFNSALAKDLFTVEMYRTHVSPEEVAGELLEKAKLEADSYTDKREKEAFEKIQDADRRAAETIEQATAQSAKISGEAKAKADELAAKLLKEAEVKKGEILKLIEDKQLEAKGILLKATKEAEEKSQVLEKLAQEKANQIVQKAINAGKTTAQLAAKDHLEEIKISAKKRAEEEVMRVREEYRKKTEADYNQKIQEAELKSVEITAEAKALLTTAETERQKLLENARAEGTRELTELRREASGIEQELAVKRLAAEDEMDRFREGERARLTAEIEKLKKESLAATKAEADQLLEDSIAKSKFAISQNEQFIAQEKNKFELLKSELLEQAKTESEKIVASAQAFFIEGETKRDNEIARIETRVRDLEKEEKRLKEKITVDEARTRELREEEILVKKEILSLESKAALAQDELEQIMTRHQTTAHAAEEKASQLQAKNESVEDEIASQKLLLDELVNRTRVENKKRVGLEKETKALQGSLFTDKESLLKEVQELSLKKSELSDTVNELIANKKLREAKDLEERNQAIDAFEREIAQLRSKTANELKDTRKTLSDKLQEKKQEQDQKLATYKLQELERIEKEIASQEKSFSLKAEKQIETLSLLMHRQLQDRLSELVSTEEPLIVLNKIREASTRLLREQLLGESDHVETATKDLHQYDPDREKRVRSWWKSRLATLTAASLAISVVFAFWGELKNFASDQMQKQTAASSQNDFVDGVKKERAARYEFPQSAQYKETYTQKRAIDS